MDIERVVFAEGRKVTLNEKDRTITMPKGSRADEERFCEESIRSYLDGSRSLDDIEKGLFGLRSLM